jgi:hypothetical protein
MIDVPTKYTKLYGSEVMCSRDRRVPDPRFHTKYLADYRGPYFQNQKTMWIPVVAVEQECCDGDVAVPGGYQHSRKNKGFDLLVNDYPFHNVNDVGGMWPEFVYYKRDYYNPKVSGASLRDT